MKDSSFEAQSELNQMLKRLSALEVREQRLRSEIAGEKSFKVTQSLSVMVPAVALSEESLFTARRAELVGRVGVLEQRRAQSRQDVKAGRANTESSERKMALLDEEIEFVEPLVREQIAPATRLLGLQRELEDT